MMRLLLDTHTFLWFYAGDSQLSATAVAHIADPTNDCFLSIASIWEIGIKTGIGKLTVRGGIAQLEDFMETNALGLLPITFPHIQALQQLPHHHRDPFDRLLIAQALTERLTLLTRDAVFQQYPASLMW